MCRDNISYPLIVIWIERENKASQSARAALKAPIWAQLAQANVFDLLLYHWARRLYLERLICDDVPADAPA